MTNREEYIEQQLNNIDLATLIVHRIDRCAFCNKKDCKFVCQPLEYKNLEFCITHIKKWLSQETEEDKKTCGNCKLHKKVEPCIGAIDKKCVNPKSESCGTYTMNDCSCNNWEVKESLGIDENHTQATNTQIKNDYGNYDEIKITVEDWNEVIDKVREIDARLGQLEKEGKVKEPKDFATCDIQPSGYGHGSFPVEKSADEMFEELGYIKEGKFSGCIAYWCDKYKKRITINWNDEYKKATDFEYQKSRGGNSVADTITEAEDKAIHKKIKELKDGK